MSEPIPASEVPENIGRNDPCPCGSERKYKKCCQRAHRLAKETAKKSREPKDLIKEDTSSWKIFELLGQVHENNALGLFHDLAHDEGPFRERYAEKSAFVQAIDDGDEILPAGRNFELAHIRLDPPDTYLVIRDDDPKEDKVHFQVVTLRPNECGADQQERDADHLGFRIWDYQRHKIERDSFDDLPSMEQFGIDWHPADD